MKTSVAWGSLAAPDEAKRQLPAAEGSRLVPESFDRLMRALKSEALPLGGPKSQGLSSRVYAALRLLLNAAHRFLCAAAIRCQAAASSGAFYGRVQVPRRWASRRVARRGLIVPAPPPYTTRPGHRPGYGLDDQQLYPSYLISGRVAAGLSAAVLLFCLRPREAGQPGDPALRGATARLEVNTSEMPPVAALFGDLAPSHITMQINVLLALVSDRLAPKSMLKSFSKTPSALLH
jgi:hypothetical protein